MVIDANAIIVTSLTQVREFAAGRDLVDGIAISGQRAWFADSRLLNMDDWNAGRLSPLWRPSADALEVGLQQGGWISYRVSVDNQQSSLRVFHRDTAIALACMMFFIAFVAGTRVIARRKRYWAFALLMAVGISLILPRPGATMAIAFAWGIFCSGISWLAFVRKSTAFNLNLAGASVLCVPVLAMGELTAIVYLENSRLRGAFTPERYGLRHRWLDCGGRSGERS